MKKNLQKKKHAEEALDRKAKANLQWCYTCTVKMFNNFVKRESTIKKVTCKECGKTFRTNRDLELCFNCERKKV